MPFYHVCGMFYPQTEALQRQNQTAFNEHLAQDKPRLKLAGPLYDAAKTRVGWMIIVEADDLAQAETYLASSPFRIADLYSSSAVYAFEPEVGRISG